MGEATTAAGGRRDRDMGHLGAAFGASQIALKISRFLPLASTAHRPPSAPRMDSETSREIQESVPETLNLGMDSYVLLVV